MERCETVIIGGGQAGLAISYHLRQRGREHVLLERDRLGGRWHSERWDSLHFQFPNWSLSLPGHSYSGDDPEGFSHYREVVEFLADYAREVDPPARLGVEVMKVRFDGSLRVETSHGEIAARNVIVATGAFPRPRVPDFASKLSPSIHQLHSSAYRAPGDLPDGGVLVIGSGSSGGQIAEELHRAGRQVYLSVSRHRRVPRRYLGKDMLWWFFELGWMDRTIDSFPDRKPPAAILLSGIDGGHDLNVRTFAKNGMVILGRAIGADNETLHLTDNLHELLADADSFCDEFERAAIEHARRIGMDVSPTGKDDEQSTPPSPTELDLRASGIATVIWCTGYRPAFEWIDLPIFAADGTPVQQRGVTACQGLYFLGLHWMHSFKSGALFGVGEDAAFIAYDIDR